MPEPARLPRWPFAVLITVLVLAGVSVVASAVVVPFYAYNPGPVYEIDNFVETDAGELNGEFYMLTILQHEASALESFLAMFDSTVDLYEREVINPDDLTPEERRLRNLQLQSASQETAQLVALSYLGYEFTGDGVLVVRVLEDVPASGTLLVGDLLTAVDGTPVFASQEVSPLIGEHAIGEDVTLTVLRDDQTIDLVVTLTSQESDPDRPIVGFTGTTFKPRPVGAPPFDIDSRNVGGPSAGLMYTLGLIDLLSEDDLLGGLGGLVRSQGLSRGRVQRHQRCIEPERDVDPVAAGDQTAGQLRRPALERPQVRVPIVDSSLPQDLAVEGVARYHRPLGRRQDRDGQRFIEDIEDSPARRDHRTDARHAVMVASVTWATHPLHAARWPHDFIVGHGVVGRVVQVVRPMVNVVRPRFDSLRPFAVTADERDALRAEHTHHLSHGGGVKLVSNDQIDEVVHVWQVFAVPALDRNFTVEAQRLNVSTGRCHVLSLGIEAVDTVTGIGSQRGGESTVAATDVNDQPPVHAAFGEDRPGLGGRHVRGWDVADTDRGKKTGKQPAYH